MAFVITGTFGPIAFASQAPNGASTKTLIAKPNDVTAQALFTSMAMRERNTATLH